MGILRKVLLVPQLKKDLISVEQLAREMRWSVNAKGDWKRVLNYEGEVLFEGMIVDDNNLYVVDQAYFVNNVEALHMNIVAEIGLASVPFAGVPFAGMADVVEESLEKWWYHLHATPALRDVDLIHQVRRIAWND